MDLCLSPDDRSSDARPPAAEKSAAAYFEGGGEVGDGRRSGAATRLNYEEVTVTAQDQGTCPVQVEGADPSTKPKQVTFAGFMPQMGTKGKDKGDIGGAAVAATRPPPSRIQGKRGRGEGSGFLGSRWADDIGGS